MKIASIIAAMIVSLASNGFSNLIVSNQTLQNDQEVAVQANITVNSSRLTYAAIADDNPAKATLQLANGKQVTAVFHNPTEADWFMQFLAQADQNYSMTINKKFGFNPIGDVEGLSSGGPDSVNFFKVDAQDSISLMILVKNSNSASVTSCKSDAYINGDVIIDGQGNNPNMLPQVTIAPSNVTLDAFTDLIRGALGDQGYFFGTEGQKDEQKSQYCH